MDIATYIGLALGVIAIVGGHVLEGGEIRSILQPTAAVIVFGGTFGAVSLSYPLKEIKEAFRASLGIFKENTVDPHQVISQILQYAHKARKGGLISLQDEIEKISDPFFKKALMLVVDGVEPEIIMDTMETELEQREERIKLHARIFESAGGYAPTVGILGAVLGLIHVMQNLSDPSTLGAGIAVAFVATIYGVGSANLLFIPIGNKLKVRFIELRVLSEMILKGVLSIQAGENPLIIKERLNAFLIKAEKGKSQTPNLKPQIE